MKKYLTWKNGAEQAVTITPEVLPIFCYEVISSEYILPNVN